MTDKMTDKMTDNITDMVIDDHCATNSLDAKGGAPCFAMDKRLLLASSITSVRCCERERERQLIYLCERLAARKNRSLFKI